jgi:hypothetical protein
LLESNQLKQGIIFRRTARSSAKTLRDDGDNNVPASAFPLAECSGDCDSSTDCFGDLRCFDRTGTEPVPGCSGLGTNAKDYCYKPNGSNNLAYVGDEALPIRSFPLLLCEGDCDSDSDCAAGLVCFQRSGTENVPGCLGAGQSGKDYCYSASSIVPTPATSMPIQAPSSNFKTLRIDGDNGTPMTAFPLPECSGDCDSDYDCFGDLKCWERRGLDPVLGCNGLGKSGKDYCYKPNGPGSLAITGDNAFPSRSFPLRRCEGDCDKDSDCSRGLSCFQRAALEPVPGCLGEGSYGKDYCYKATPTFVTPTSSPTSPPPPSTQGPVIIGGPTYVPGELTVFKEGLRLSTGLDVRKIAIKDQPVQYANGGTSSINFHVNPDGAAVFLKDDNSGNYFYVSNSEVSVSGGVGSIEFDANGNILGYKRVLSSTDRNCGGGRSPYNTWLSCEEDESSGFVWEVSPNGDFTGRKTNLVPRGGNYESVAYHFDTVLQRNIYYITEDSSSGPLVQFTPSDNLGTREEMYSAGTHRFLRVDVGNSGTFSWVLDRNGATPYLYRNAEGIDVKDNFLYFVSKVDKTLFILDLKEGTFTRESTNNGAVSILNHWKNNILRLPNLVSIFLRGEDSNVMFTNSDLHSHDTFLLHACYCIL